MGIRSKLTKAKRAKRYISYFQQGNHSASHKKRNSTGKWAGKLLRKLLR